MPLNPKHAVQRFEGADGLSLAADLYGEPGGTPVIFLHGGGQSRRSWRGAAHAAGNAGFFAIALDLRGHGDSDWAPDGDYGLSAHVRDLREVMTQIRGRPVLVGASRGGTIALMAGNEAKAVLLVDFTPKIDPQGLAQIRGFMQASARGFSSVEEAADVLATYMKRPKRGRADGLISQMRHDAHGRLYWRWDPLLALDRHIDPVAEEEPLEKAARDIKVPALLLRGEHSKLVTPETVVALKALMPDLHVITVPGVDHMVTGDANDPFNVAILDFLNRLTTSGTLAISETPS